ncbi:MAG: hypothetical protein EKK46_03825 [Rhodocyclaceae bacterium]|nr:MAG: hypothetical protein EKK46_03825 [Rhodocyclaceae bacterium]
MFSIRFPDRLHLALLAALTQWALAGTAADNHGPTPFTTQTWKHLVGSLPRPSAVVFSTTDCVHCPAVIEGLADDFQHQPKAKRGKLVVVVMDDAAPATILGNAHFQKADRLYVFTGNEQALRYTVSPGWRGLTPFVALLSGKREVRFHTGPLPLEEQRQFLQGR